MTTVSGWDDESVLLNVMVIEATLVYESHRKRRASTCSNDDDTRSNTKYGDTVDSRAPLFHAAKVYLAMVQIMPIHEILASTLIEKMTLQIFQTYHQGATFLQWCGAKTTTWSTQ
ncbi:uncharacterized protein [Zea mays]|uniref:uncharacterized protein isoform X1 n=1 Tax=Zea mays TaxID=4577 RepID=UPI0009A95F3C|nr:uncharacterized protein LOC103632167 isoform X1 [Zea mays]|eukprot:XP_020396828.1 uncharacterized protein LOC103632167 isoform X1 [Zea mays]